MDTMDLVHSALGRSKMSIPSITTITACGAQVE